MLPDEHTSTVNERKGPSSQAFAISGISSYRPADRRAIERYGEQIVNAWRRGRKMANLRAQYGISQRALEQLLQERIGRAA